MTQQSTVLQSQNNKKEFLSLMHSFVYEKDQNKIISAQKPIPKPPTTVNPFYEFVSNMKPSNTTVPINNSNNQRPSSVSVPTQPCVSSERKNSNELSDPRKMLPIIKVNTNQVNLNTQKPQISQASKPYEPREKRSRSRDKKYQQNRENSQTPSGKQKNPEFYRKTRLCPLYEKGQCQKDSSNCNFAHGFHELRCYKTQLCYAFEKGQCKKSTEQCKYAHGKKQLRSINEDNEPTKNTYENRDKNHLSQQRHKQHHKERASESNHHYDRKDKDRQHNYKTDSPAKYSKKQKSQLVHDPLSYKKNLPLSKEYEKFLYGDSNPMVNPVQSKLFSNHENSMYTIPNELINTQKTSYSMEAYSIHLDKNFQSYPRSSLPFGYSDIERPFKDLSKGKDGLRQLFYEKPPLDLHKTNHPYLNQIKPFTQKKPYPDTSYPDMSHHGFGKANDVSPYHAPSSNFGQDFSKCPYKNSNQGSFNERPYSSGLSKSDNFGDSGYRRPSNYPEVSKQVGRTEDFYRNDSFYSSQNKKADFGGLRVGGNSNLSGYRQGFSGNGGYNRYPTMDNDMSQVGKSVSGYSVRPYDDKGRYSDFSNRGYQ